ncbi:MAG TPA: adenylate/guanylate cyclase domain-containing protein [Burkholderiaceae bacterium]|nr:adenylate/guanylate cyclase domain-containing protein [Burkholderiaceae bacterium]
MTMREIIRQQTVLSQELVRRFERLAALAFTDIVESSAYFAHFGDEAGQRLQLLHFDLLEQSMVTGAGTHLGRIVDTAGDGAFACFASAGAAVQVMMALQDRITLANVSRPRPHQLSVRVGLHWGHVLTDGVQVTGDAVNLCARLVATARPGEIRLSRDLFQELNLDLRHRCRPLGPVNFKGITRGVELMALLWRDPARFPSHVVIRESGECIALPSQDTVYFGRGEQADRTTANDVALGLPDALMARQVSRRHFELRAQPGEYLLKALTSQSTEVDGVTMQRDQELPIRPGSCIKLADVMTLDFVSPSLADDGTMGATLGRPRASLT